MLAGHHTRPFGWYLRDYVTGGPGLRLLGQLWC